MKLDHRIAGHSVEGLIVRVELVDQSEFDFVFGSEANALKLSGILNDIVSTSNTYDQIAARITELDLDGGNELLGDLLRRGVLGRAASKNADDARSFHASLAQEFLSDDMDDATAFQLAQEANDSTLVVDQKLQPPELGTSAAELLFRGRSVRSGTEEEITFERLSNLLAMIYGRFSVLEQARQAWDIRGVTGSAGGVFPVRLIVHTREGFADNKPHSWLYLRKDHALARIDHSPDSAQQRGMLSRLLNYNRLGALLSVMIDLEWSQRKYGNHAYRFALLEAGAVMQNLRLVSRELGLENWPCGLPLDRQLDAILPDDCDYLHAVSIGLSKAR